MTCILIARSFWSTPSNVKLSTTRGNLFQTSTLGVKGEAVADDVSYTEKELIQRVTILAEDVKCFVSPNLVNWLKRKELHKELAAIQNQVLVIRTLLPRIMPLMLIEMVLRDPTFSIEVTDKLGIEGSNGRYFPYTNELKVLADPDMDEVEAEAILKNEFHSVLLRYRNLILNNNAPIGMRKALLLTYPFLKRNSDSYLIDDGLVEQHRQAIDNGLERLQRLRALVNQAEFPDNGREIRDSKDEKLLSQFNRSLSEYKPKPLRIKSTARFSLINAMNERVKEEGSLLLGLNNGRSGYVRHLIIYRGENTIVKLSLNADESWQEKAKALFIHVDDYIYTIKHEGYAHMRPFEKDAEFSSFLQELPEPVLQVIFKEWCQYFTRYHQLEIGSYCAASFSP